MPHNLIHENRRPVAIVITRLRAQDRLPHFPWLETFYRIDESDWIVLFDEVWEAVASGDAAIWDAFERKLFISYYINQPAFIAIVGHPSGRSDPDGSVTGQDEVERIARRVRSCGLPAAVLGFWAGEGGEFEQLIDPGHSLDLAEENQAIV